MRVCTWVIVCGMLIGSITQAGEAVRVTRRTTLSISSENDAVGEVWVTSTSPSSAGWLSFRNGQLWSDYCRSPHCGAPSAPAKARLTHLALPESGKVSAGTRCRHSLSPRQWLRELFGWRYRPKYQVARQERLECPEPASVLPLDDLPPTPPASLDAFEPRKGENSQSSSDPSADMPPSVEFDVAPMPTDPALNLPLPVDSDSPEPPVDAEGDIELSPYPADDPVPEPGPSVPRNELPRRRSAQDSQPGRDGRTVMAGRLSDFIRTR
ncbi:MAG: hypothetical protein ACYC4U_23580 [Pirellulaceae bacterium]